MLKGVILPLLELLVELILQIGAAVGAILRIGELGCLVPWCGIFRFWLVGWVGHSYSALLMI